MATGENAEKIEPQFEGLQDFDGHVMHAGDYKSGVSFRGKRVLVVGCGNSGMEVSIDLCNHNAKPSMVVRSSVSQYIHTYICSTITVCRGGVTSVHILF